MQPRYDKEKGVYRDCKFCGGMGCLACEGEANKAYKRAFPDGPKPIATFQKNNKEDMEEFGKILELMLHPAACQSPAMPDDGKGEAHDILKNILRQHGGGEG